MLEDPRRVMKVHTINLLVVCIVNLFSAHFPPFPNHEVEDLSHVYKDPDFRKKVHSMAKEYKGQLQ